MHDVIIVIIFVVIIIIVYSMIFKNWLLDARLAVCYTVPFTLFLFGLTIVVLAKSVMCLSQVNNKY